MPNSHAKSSENSTSVSRTVALACIFLVALTPLAFTFRTTTYHITKITAGQMLVLVAVAMWLISMGKRGRVAVTRNPLNLPIVISIAACAVSAISAINHFASFRAGLELLAFCGLFFLAANNLRKFSSIAALTALMVAVGAAVGCYGFLQSMGLDFAPTLEGVGAVSTLGNINFAAAFLIAVIPICIARMAIAGPRLRPLYAVALAVMLAHLWLTHTIGAWIGLAVSLPLIAAVFSRQIARQLWRFRHVLIACVVVAFLAVFLIAAIRPQWAIEIEPFRLHAWRSTLWMIGDHALRGVGLGNFAVVYPLYRSPEEWAHVGHFVGTLRPHNQFLGVAAETGVVGLLVFLWFIVRLVRLGGGFVQRLTADEKGGAANSSSRNGAIIGCGLFASVIATLGNSFFSFNLSMPSAAFYFWLSAGMMVALWAMRGEDVEQTTAETDAPRSIVFTRVVVWMAAIFLICIGTPLLLKPYLAEIHGKNSDELFRKKDWEAAAAECEKAISFYPADVPVRHRYALCLRYLERPGEAIGQFLSALRLQPNRPWTLAALGELYLEESDIPAAVEVLGRAARTNPYYYNFLARAHVEDNNLSLALSTVKKALLSQLDQQVTYYNLGVIHEKMGNPGAAKEAYNESVNIDGRYLLPHRRIAELAEEEKKPAKAAVHYQAILDVRPDDLQALRGMCLASLDLGRFHDAHVVGEKLVRLRPNAWNAHALLAYALEGIGEKDQAIKAWKHVLELNPKNEQAPDNLRRLGAD